MLWRELAFEISLTSLGSSQTLPSPQPNTDAARRFWVLRLTLQPDTSQHVCVFDSPCDLRENFDGDGGMHDAG